MKGSYHKDYSIQNFSGDAVINCRPTLTKVVERNSSQRYDFNNPKLLWSWRSFSTEKDINSDQSIALGEKLWVDLACGKAGKKYFFFTTRLGWNPKMWSGDYLISVSIFGEYQG